MLATSFVDWQWNWQENTEESVVRERWRPCEDHERKYFKQILGCFRQFSVGFSLYWGIIIILNMMATVLSPMVSHKTHVIQGYLHYIIITTQSISLFYTDGRPKKIHQDLSYDDSLSGRPGAWLVKFFFYMHAITKLKNNLILKFKMISRTSFFFIAFMVYQ